MQQFLNTLTKRFHRDEKIKLTHVKLIGCLFIIWRCPGVENLQLFQNKMTNAQQMPGGGECGMGTLGIDSAIMKKKKAVPDEIRFRSFYR